MHDLRLAIPVAIAWAMLAGFSVDASLIRYAGIAAWSVAGLLLLSSMRMRGPAGFAVRLVAVGVAFGGMLLAGAAVATAAGLDACSELTFIALAETPPAEVLVIGCDGVGAARSAVLLPDRGDEALSALAIGATAAGSCDAWLDGARWLITCRDLEVGEPAPIAAWATPLRDGLLQATAGLPGGGGQLVPGLAIGDTRRLEPGLEASMLATGLTHLTAVSGANCVIVVGAAYAATSALGARRSLRVATAAVALVGFTVLVTPEPSVVRASVMAAIGLLGVVTGRKTGAISVLALAVLLVLTVQPHLATSPGFALSVMATCALIVHAVPLARLLGRWLPVPLAGLISVPVAAQLWCLPVLVALQPTVSVVATLANLLAGPAAPLATIAGLVVCLAAPFAPGVAAFLGWIAWLPAAWIAGVAEVGARLPIAEAPWPGAPWGALIAATIVAAITIGHARARIGRGVAVAMALAIVASGIAALPALRVGTLADWRIAQCDVGQGNATVIRSGPATVLVDTGPSPEALAACLRTLSVSRIDLVVLTHFDLDHVGGIDAIAGRVGTVVHGPVAEGDAGVLRTLTDVGARASRASRGDVWRVGDIRIEALWPEPPRAGRGETTGNDASVATAIDLPGEGVELVVLGDLGAEAQSRLLRAGVPGAGVVVTSHHGSADQLPALYRTIGASVALVGVGENDYGHPTSEALSMLTSGGTLPLRTDERGTIAIELTPEGFRVWSEREGGGMRVGAPP